ncbi:WXG100 family type VII secretion target [Saccharopolyspora rectivirgula]|uniref:WXG100 family type VII secretion target n=1 Tax=Saccharopolyspora rectivirgula TaxID=28042 RepID=UPI00191C1B69|nr:hypothetical protein [Saccharopolyspora rectivirgula]
MSGAQTSGSDLQKAARAFSDSSEEISNQVKKIAESGVTADKAGWKFVEAGQAYMDLLERLGDNVKAFSEHSMKLSESFQESAKEYQSSDQSGASEIGKVEV